MNELFIWKFFGGVHICKLLQRKTKEHLKFKTHQTVAKHFFNKKYKKKCS